MTFFLIWKGDIDSLTEFIDHLNKVLSSRQLTRQLTTLLYQEAAKHAENQSAAGAKESTKPPRLPAVTTIRPLKYFTLLTASHHGLFTLLSVTSAIYST